MVRALGPWSVSACISAMLRTQLKTVAENESTNWGRVYLDHELIGEAAF